MTNEQRRAVVRDFIDWLYEEGYEISDEDGHQYLDDAHHLADQFVTQHTVKCDEQCSRCC